MSREYTGKIIQKARTNAAGFEEPQMAGISRQRLTNLQDMAFDPTDGSAGSLAFVEGDAGVFQQITEALFEADAAITKEICRASSVVPDPANAGHAFPETRHSTGRCFAAGAVMQTDKGQKQVQDIRPGDRVLTRDHGFCAVTHVGHRHISADEQIAQPDFSPVLIAEGALGPSLPDRPMQVSPDHGFLVEGPRTKLLFGEREVLVPAAHLLGYPGITRAPLASVDYYYVMCAAHEVIWTDGVWTESAQPDDWRLLGFDGATLAHLFPALDCEEDGYPAARRTLLRHEADLLLA
jgi:hypothetical protein